MDELKLHDVVALTKPIPEHNLQRGEISVIIDVGPNSYFLLEFSNQNAIPYAIPTVSPEDFMKVFLHADTAE